MVCNELFWQSNKNPLNHTLSMQADALVALVMFFFIPSHQQSFKDSMTHKTKKPTHQKNWSTCTVIHLFRVPPKYKATGHMSFGLSIELLFYKSVILLQQISFNKFGNKFTYYYECSMTNKFYKYKKWFTLNK